MSQIKRFIFFFGDKKIMTKQKEQTILPKQEHRWNDKGTLEQKVTIIQHLNTADRTVGIRAEWMEVTVDKKAVYVH